MRRKSFENYRKDFEKARKYQKEIQEIKEKYSFDKKEEFIQTVNKYIENQFFLEELCSRFYNVAYFANNCKLIDEFWGIFEKYNADIDNYNIDIQEVESSSNGIYFYRTYAGNWETETESIMTLPIDIDLIQLLEDLDVFEEKCKEQFKILKEQEENRKKLEAIRKEKEEYALYLKLKEKYEG